MEEVVKKQMLSLPEVKEMLSKSDPESMDQIQRWTHDYVSKFSKVEPKAAKKMKSDLINQCGLTEEGSGRNYKHSTKVITRITFIYIWMEKTNSLRDTRKDPQNY